MKTAYTLSFCLMLLMSGLSAQNEPFTMTQLGQNQSLNFPWEITWGPDGFLWITEREDGQVTRVDPNSGQQDVILTLTDMYVDARQDGLLGMALHPELGQGTGNDYVYLSYTIQNGGREQQLVRYSYTVQQNGKGNLSNPLVILSGLPSSNDHNSGRLVYGPDGKLYYTIGDQGSNQGGNKCKELLTQAIPTQAEITAGDYSKYPGKVLRINPDGSIPADNPVINGVRSHIFSYGHRNPQGLTFADDGTLYSHEHGHKTDDEVNLIVGGGNYGWPFVAGFIDDMAYTYCNWSTANNCNNLNYDSYTCPGSATEQDETDWAPVNFQAPMGAYFTVPNNFQFNNPNCSNSFICWPTIAPSSMEVYEDYPLGIPGWDHSLIISSLKKGLLYRLSLSPDGTQITSDTMSFIRTQNRYRDLAIDPTGTKFFVITDNNGRTSTPTQSNTQTLLNPGTILRFDYTGPTGIDPALALPTFTLWTDQYGEQLTVDVGTEVRGERTVQVLDLQGRIVASKRGIQATYSFPTTAWSHAVYLVRVTGENGQTASQKWIHR